LASNNFLDGKISREQLEKEFDNAQVNLITNTLMRLLQRQTEKVAVKIEC
jgi:hypothetical protein